MERSPEIEQRLFEFVDVLARGATDEVSDFVCHHPGVVQIGTAPHEWTVGFEQAIRDWAGEATADDRAAATFRLTDVHAWAERGVGWAACRFSQETAVGTFHTRYSGVWRLEEGVWRIMHHHVSFGVANVDVFGRELSGLDDFPVEPRDSVVLHPVAAPDGTVSLMFTDIEDSTRLNERLGDDAWIGILADHDQIVRRCVAAHHGIEVKHQGDGFMLGFSNPADAVGCAIDVQRQMPAESRGERLRIRAGIHHGATVVTSNDFFGRSVAFAARIASTARGGEIVVSDDVAEMLGGAIPLAAPFEATLKGFEGVHRVHRVRWDEDVAADA